MKCLACGSDKLSQGYSQTYISFPVSMFKSVCPKAHVCLQCGTVQFRVAPEDLAVLKHKEEV